MLRADPTLVPIISLGEEDGGHRQPSAGAARSTEAIMISSGGIAPPSSGNPATFASPHAGGTGAISSAATNSQASGSLAYHSQLQYTAHHGAPRYAHHAAQPSMQHVPRSEDDTERLGAPEDLLLQDTEHAQPAWTAAPSQPAPQFYDAGAWLYSSAYGAPAEAHSVYDHGAGDVIVHSTAPEGHAGFDHPDAPPGVRPSDVMGGTQPYVAPGLPFNAFTGTAQVGGRPVTFVQPIGLYGPPQYYAVPAKHVAVTQPPSAKRMVSAVEVGTHAKPNMSYAALITWALREAPTGKMTLSQIYEWIKSRFPYYRTAEAAWQNSIRHNLSLNKCFRKLQRPPTEPGKGGFWTLDLEYMAQQNYAKQQQLLVHQATRAAPVRREQLPAASQPAPGADDAKAVVIDPVVNAAIDAAANAAIDVYVNAAGRTVATSASPVEDFFEGIGTPTGVNSVSMASSTADIDASPATPETKTRGRRGRPPGSKNRVPKDHDDDVSGGSSTRTLSGSASAMSQLGAAATGTQSVPVSTPAPVAMPAAQPSAPQVYYGAPYVQHAAYAQAVHVAPAHAYYAAPYPHVYPPQFAYGPPPVGPPARVIQYHTYIPTGEASMASSASSVDMAPIDAASIGKAPHAVAGSPRAEPFAHAQDDARTVQTRRFAK